MALNGWTRWLAGSLMAGGLLMAADTSAEYGKYLVEEVAKCGDCHTARTKEGKPDTANLLKGAEIDFVMKTPPPKWEGKAPGLTPSGRLWSKWGEDGLKKYLVTALTPRGGHSDPPMPEYHFHESDAQAIVAYLKTLK